MSGEIIILEEAAYCDPGLINEVVVPLLSVTSSVLLCISTLLEGTNHYSKMFNLTDPQGKKIFESIQITLVCDECMKTDHPERCTHMLKLLPRWLSSQKMDTVRAMLADDPAMLLRESLGVSADGSTAAFGSADVERMLDTRRALGIQWSNATTDDDFHQHAIVAVDPSGGGCSAFSICSMTQNRNGTFIVRSCPASPPPTCCPAARTSARSCPGPGSSSARTAMRRKGALSAACPARTAPPPLRRARRRRRPPRAARGRTRAAARGAPARPPAWERSPSPAGSRRPRPRPRGRAPKGAARTPPRARGPRPAPRTPARARTPRGRTAEGPAASAPWQIFGVDRLITKDVRATHELLLRHIARVRSIPGMAYSMLVFSFESNLAFESQHLLHAVSGANVQKWVALSEGAGGGMGWLTSNERKEAMCLQLRECMSVGSIVLSKDFFSCTMEVPEALRVMKDELCRFSVVTEPGKTPFAKPRKTYSGKLGGQQDDLAVSIQLAITGLRKFFTAEKYRRFLYNN